MSGVKLCPECTGNGWTYSCSDDKITCPLCGGSGHVPSDDPEDSWNEVVTENGRTVVRPIDISR